MSSYQYRKSHCGDNTILRPSYLHNEISYTGKMTSLYWIRALDPAYLADIHIPYKPRNNLRSASKHYLDTPCTFPKTCGDWAFMSTAPRPRQHLWIGSSLAQVLACEQEVQCWQSGLTKFYFQKAKTKWPRFWRQHLTFVCFLVWKLLSFDSNFT